MTITEFLLARIAEDEALAREAIDPARPGTHWHWVNRETDEPVDRPTWEDPASLRTVEEFPTTSGVGDLPAFPIDYVEADETRALPHIARHDPARVLAECEAKRRIIEWCDRLDTIESSGPHDDLLYVRIPASAMRLALASVYADHPDCRDEWRP